MHVMPGLFDGTSLERPVSCEVCGAALEQCTCPRDASGSVCRPADQPARVHREKRRGKWMTVVTGLDPKATDLAMLSKQLRKSCSAGGAVTADGVEIQGDHRDAVVAALRGLGYPARAAGG